MKGHYSQTYFAWQKKAGEYAANQDLWLYQSLIKKTDSILDFGCGGGYLLQKIQCKERFGIDINPFARTIAKNKGVTVFSHIDELPKISFDVIILHHSLEHLENPAQILKSLKYFLKRNGRLICVVPIDDWRQQKKYTEKDINKHLFTWTPLLIGNLFTLCGYTLQKAEIVHHAWLPLSRFYYQYIPRPIYYLLANVWSRIINYRLIRVVAAV